MPCSLQAYNKEQMAVICMNMLNTKLVAAIKSTPRHQWDKNVSKEDRIALALETVLSDPTNAVIKNIIEHTQFKRSHSSKFPYKKLALQFRYVN